MARPKGSKNKKEVKEQPKTVRVDVKTIDVKPPVIEETDNSVTLTIDDSSVFYEGDPAKPEEQTGPEKVAFVDIKALRVCPKCKGTRIYQTRLDSGYVKYCDDCGHVGPGSKIDYKDAERLWNEQ